MGTSMDGLDICHVHWTQEHPEAPLNMEILHEGEIPFDGKLKRRRTSLLKFLSGLTGLRNRHEYHTQ
jgi:hypothetical protein